MHFSSLQVLHIQSYNNQGNDENPLAEFKTAVNPFSPMTCARHVYIFTKTTEYNIKALQTYVDSHSKKCEWLTGIQAYGFLLRWAVGVESNKLKSNDHFVLGDIRDAWNYYHAANNKIDATLIKLMQILLEDARHIRHGIQDTKVNDDAFKELLIRMCKNCVDSRERNEPPAYESLLKDNQDYLETAKREFLRKKMTSLSKSMKALNIKSEIDNVSPSLLNENTPQMRMFRTNITYALQKHQLTHDSQPQEIEPLNNNSFIKQM